MQEFSQKKCKPCESGTKPHNESDIQKALKNLKGWKYEGGMLAKTYSFINYYQTTAFVNAVVWISHCENHHPDIMFSYKKATIRYKTHAIDGISENDFICAAKIEAFTAKDVSAS